MNKKVTRVFLAALLALSVTTAVLLPTITSAYAATAPSDSPKDNTDPHSGHH
jgi:hypothetical protein